MLHTISKTFSCVLLLGGLSLGWSGCSPCGYGEQDCASIPLGTRIEELPMTSKEPNTGGYAEEFAQGPIGDVNCCYACTQKKTDCSHCGVDCSAPEQQAEPLDVGGKYAGGCAGFEWCSMNQCTVWVRDGRVVAIQTYCF